MEDGGSDKGRASRWYFNVRSPYDPFRKVRRSKSMGVHRFLGGRVSFSPATRFRFEIALYSPASRGERQSDHSVRVRYDREESFARAVNGDRNIRVSKRDRVKVRAERSIVENFV